MDWGRFRDALDYGHHQLGISEELDNAQMRSEAYLNLARAHEKLGEFFFSSSLVVRFCCVLIDFHRQQKSERMREKGRDMCQTHSIALLLHRKKSWKKVV